MGTLNQLLGHLAELDTEFCIEQAFELTEGQFTKYNRLQMQAGLLRDGNPITRLHDGNIGSEEYTLRYANKSKGGRLKPIDLHLEGGFQEGLFNRVNGETLEQGSSDYKNDFLRYQYSGKITGLGGEYRKDYLVLSYRPEFMTQIRKTVKL